MKNIIMTLLIIAFFAGNLFAEYRAEKPAGEGTNDSPYLMESVENLLWLSENVTNVASGSYFLQTKDIDASETKGWRDGKGFPPIGTYDWMFSFSGSTKEALFCGTYDGNNRVISGLYFALPSNENCGGLFGGVTNSCLKNIKLENITMKATYVSGALAGFLASTSVSNCHAQITFTQDGDSSSGNGGLIGEISKFAEIDCCSAKVKNLKGGYSGGIIGYCIVPYNILEPSVINIRKCFAEGNICGDWVGGLVGNPGNQPMEDCYSLVDMSGRYNVGGITAFGAKYCKNCYYYGNIENGNPISGGDSSGTASGAYYCSEQGTDPNPGTIGKTYAELLKKETYEGWDFENTWYIEEDVSLPTLSWEMPEPGIFSLLVAAFGLFVFKRR